jgi:ketosteroid isomerase-like protein
MRRWSRLFAVVACVLAIHTATAVAQEEEVRAAMLETLASWSNGDFDRFAQSYHEEVRGFLFGGGTLARGFNAAALAAAYEAGFRAEMELRDIDVRVLGDIAVGVAYADGSLTLPGGAPEVGSWRYSETRIREGGSWKIVQYHFSKLTLP